MERNVKIFTKKDALSDDVRKQLCSKLGNAGFCVVDDDHPYAELIICIGGDGTFLRSLRHYKFPDTPIVGINTGHLGFFQEFSPEHLSEFIEIYTEGRFMIQKCHGVKATFIADGVPETMLGMNEIVLRGEKSIHLDISIGNSLVQRFSGDGVLICTPAGSTAYNYALGGSIIDPGVKVLQITPMAPMNTSAYRSFTSSVIVPDHLAISIEPRRNEDKAILVMADGKVKRYKTVEQFKVSFAEESAYLLRFEDYDFWKKVKGKLLER